MTLERKGRKLLNEWYALRNPVERIGDAHREKMQDKISDAYVAGYLDKGEFDRRTEIVSSAKFEHELAWADDDLPTRIPLPRKQEMSALELAEQDWPFRTQRAEDERVYWWIFGIVVSIAMILVVLGVISMATH